MAGLAFPGKSSIHREIAKTEAFIEAINDGSLRMRIKDKETKVLEQALRIALLAKAKTAERVSVDAVETKVKDYKVRSAQSAHSAMSASSVENAMVAGVKSEVKEKDGLDKRYEEMCEAMETLSKSLAAMSAKTSASVSAPQQARPPPTCYKCGVIGHFQINAGQK